MFCIVDTWPTINIFPLILNVQYRWKLENKFWTRDLAVLLWGNKWTCSMVPWNSLGVRYGLLSTEFPWLCPLTGVKKVAHRGNSPEFLQAFLFSWITGLWPCKVISWKQFQFYLFPCKLCSNYPTGRNVSTQKGVWLPTFYARHLVCGISAVAGCRLILVGSSYLEKLAVVLLMEETLHQLIGSLSHYSQGFSTSQVVVCLGFLNHEQ